MDAILQRIAGHNSEADVWIAGRDKFNRVDGETVSSQIVIDEAGWWPYAIEPEQRQMIFVALQPEIDLVQSVFVYATQLQEAHHILTVPYDSLPALMAQVPPPDTLLDVSNIGRCGSTLLNQALNQIEGVWSLSEPDIYTIVGTADRNGADEADLKLVLEARTRLLFRPPDPRTRVLGIKPRSQGTFCADLMHSAFPGARYLYLYRDGLSWAISWHQFLQRQDIPVEMDEELFDMGWLLLTNQRNSDYLAPYISGSASDHYLEEINALAWAFNMEYYLQQREAGIPYFALRYNELVDECEATLSALFAHCGLPMTALEAAIAGFEQDSQRGTAIARDQAVDQPFTEAHAERFLTMLVRHPQFSNPHTMLPDIGSD